MADVVAPEEVLEQVRKLQSSLVNVQWDDAADKKNEALAGAQEVVNNLASIDWGAWDDVIDDLRLLYFKLHVSAIFDCARYSHLTAERSTGVKILEQMHAWAQLSRAKKALSDAKSAHNAAVMEVSSSVKGSALRAALKNVKDTKDGLEKAGNVLSSAKVVISGLEEDAEGMEPARTLDFLSFSPQNSRDGKRYFDERDHANKKPKPSQNGGAGSEPAEAAAAAAAEQARLAAEEQAGKEAEEKAVEEAAEQARVAAEEQVRKEAHAKAVGRLATAIAAMQQDGDAEKNLIEVLVDDGCSAKVKEIGEAAFELIEKHSFTEDAFKKVDGATVFQARFCMDIGGNRSWAEIQDCFSAV